MLTSETLKRIRRIELRTRKLVDEAFAGAYHAVFKGRGIAFESVRPYFPGDDVRDIDWNVTARTGEAHIKQYIEERELTVMIVLDASASVLFGTTTRQKRDLAAELGALLAYSAITNNDKVGLILFTDTIEQIIAPRKGRKHVLRLIRDLLADQPEQKATDIALALKTVSRVLKRRSIVFLISDFLVDPETYTRDLAVLSKAHDLIAVVVRDPREQQLNDTGIVALGDAETGKTVYIDSGRPAWRRKFQQQVIARDALLAKALQTSRIDRIDISTDGDYVSELVRFFQYRVKKRR